MNKIYKLRLDKRRNELVVVSEIITGASKEKSTGHIADLSSVSAFRKLLGTLTPLAFLTSLVISLFPMMALANPSLPVGGQIVGGQGSISTSGNQMTIQQQTHNIVTRWQSFDIGRNNVVQFIQPDSSSVALNRVTGTSGSQIMGTLKANGQVFILNPNGVLFGKDSRVNVAGMVASTKNISTADFMKGQYTLRGEGNPGAQVISQGSLTTTKGGYIVLAGQRVSNSGTIATPSGKTVLAAGLIVTLQLDNGGLTSVSVNGSVVNALVENLGLISAANGQVYLTAKGQDMLLNTLVNNSGTIEAKGLESRGGEIVLNGGDSGMVSQSGHLLADSRTGLGGKITMEGQNIHLTANSSTSAIGKTGGGEVYVGGGWQGMDNHIKNASKVVMNKAATVDVSATENGNGGTVVLWSDDYTNFRGGILAQGGVQSGNGGRVETSSHRNLFVSGEVNASARAGRGGSWLLDPADVDIVNTDIAETSDSNITADRDGVFHPTADGSHIFASSINSQLNNGTSITIKTSGTDVDGQLGNITIRNDVTISKTSGSDASLSLIADNNINIGNDNNNITGITIKSTEGKLNLNLLAGNTKDNATIMYGKATLLDLHGGDFVVGSANSSHHVTLNSPHADGGTINAGNITLNADSSLAALNFNATNNITVNGVFSESAGWNQNVTWDAGDRLKIAAPSGTISFLVNDADNGFGHINLSGKNGVELQALHGGIILSSAGDINHSLNITSTAGDVNFTAMNPGGTGIEVNNINVSAKNSLVINGTGSGANSGVWMHAGIIGNSLTATNVSLSGQTISASGGGLIVHNTLLNATRSDFIGVAKTSGLGFSLANITLLGGLTNLDKVNFSSAGSAEGVTNELDNSVVNQDNRDTLLAKHIENMTTLDMNGTAIFDDSSKSVKGWTHNYSTVDKPNGGWVFNHTTVTAGGDVSLKGVGFINSTVKLTDGNLDIDNAGTAPLTGSTLNISNGNVSVHAGVGNIDLTKGNISAKNNISLTADNGSVVIVGTNSTSVANVSSSNGSVSLYGKLPNSRGDQALVLTNVSIVSKDKTSLEGTTGWGIGVALSDLNIISGGDIDITGYATNQGVRLAPWVYNESTGLKMTGGDITSQTGNITLSGNSSSVFTGQVQYAAGGAASFGRDAMTVSNSNITANAGKILLHGKSKYVTGVNVTSSNFSADSLEVIGSTAISPASLTISGVHQAGVGFSIKDSHMLGNLTDLSHVIFSSAGSYASVTNQIDGVFVNDSNLGVALKWHPENTTYLEMHNKVIFDDTSKKIKGWTGDYLDGSVIVRHAVVTAAGNVDLKGVSLRDSTITVTNGSLHMENKGVVDLGGSVVNVSQGDVNITSEQAGINLTNVSARNDIVLKSDNGSLIVSGSGAKISSEKGNLSLTGNNAGNGNGISISGASLIATNGSINVSANSAATMDTADPKSAVFFSGNTTVNAKNGANITGYNQATGRGAGAGVGFGPGTMTWSGSNVSVYGTAAAGPGIYYYGSANINVSDGETVTYCGKSGSRDNDDYFGNAGILFSGNTYKKTIVTAIVDSGSSLHFIGTGQNNVPGIASRPNNVIPKPQDGSLVIKGGGEVSVSGGGDSAAGVILSMLDTSRATGSVNVNGTSTSNVGVYLSGNLSNTTISGASIGSGDGVQLGGLTNTGKSALGSIVGDKSVTITGKSVDGDGVILNGTATGLLIRGNSTNGSGVLVSGNTTIKDMDISGGSETGEGVNVVENLTLNAGSHVSGQSVSGTGVNLVSTLSGGSVAGTSASGSGVKLSDNTLATNTSLSGTSTTGSGVSVAGNVTLDKHTVESLKATSGIGTGLELGQGHDAALHVISDAGVSTPLDKPVVIGGYSGSGSAVATYGNVSLSGAVLSGSTSAAQGTGITVNGNLTFSDMLSGIEGHAEGHGTGVNIAGSVNGGVVSGESVWGAGVTVSNGSHVTNVTIDGHSSTGTGVEWGSKVINNNVTISGNATSGTGIHLDDNTTLNNATVSGYTAEGTGVTITGNLTSVDNTTVSGNATGSGTGVYLNNSTVKGGLVHGDSFGGAGVRVDGHSTINHATVNDSTTHGTGLIVNGSLSLIQDATLSNTVNPGGTGQAVIGEDHIQEVPSVTMLARMIRQSMRQQSFISAQSREGVRLQADYQPASMEVRLCDDNKCQLLILDVNKAGPATITPAYPAKFGTIIQP